MLEIIPFDGRYIARVGNEDIRLPIGGFPDEEAAIRASIEFGSGIAREAKKRLAGLHGKQLTSKIKGMEQ